MSPAIGVVGQVGTISARERVRQTPSLVHTCCGAGPRAARPKLNQCWERAAHLSLWRHHTAVRNRSLRRSIQSTTSRQHALVSKLLGNDSRRPITSRYLLQWACVPSPIPTETHRHRRGRGGRPNLPGSSLGSFFQKGHEEGARTLGASPHGPASPPPALGRGAGEAWF